MKVSKVHGTRERNGDNKGRRVALRTGKREKKYRGKGGRNREREKERESTVPF